MDKIVERFISVDFEYERRTKGETTKTKMEARLTLKGSTTFDEIEEFRRQFANIYKRAKSLLKAYDRWDDFTISVGDYEKSDDEYSMFGVKSAGFNSWVLDSYNQGDPNDAEFTLYAEPNTRYTSECWDMLVYSDIIRTLAEAHV